MPAKNVIKEYVGEQYYHIYSRGVNKQPIFIDEKDYVVFLSLFKRYLSREKNISSWRKEYVWFGDRIELISFCLMQNHFHLFVYQHDEFAIAEFMRALSTSYSMYFNKRHKRVGPLFQSRYKASRIENEAYLQHITRYIHLNPKDWRTYKFSSFAYFMNEKKAQWINPKRITDLFTTKTSYYAFLEDYNSHKQVLDDLKWELADR